MSPARVEVTAQESMAAATLDHLVAGARVTTAAHHCHPLALLGVAPDGSLELPRIVLDQSPHDRHVGPAERAVFELRRKCSMARIVAGDDDQARRALVEPVHDARTQHASDRGPAAAAAQKGVYQRAGVMTRRRMHDHARGLVDDGEVLVLVQDLEWNRLGLGAGAVSLRDLELHTLPNRHASAGGLAPC